MTNEEQEVYCREISGGFEKIRMVSIIHVQEEDRYFWLKLDMHLPECEFKKKIRDKMGYVLLENNIPSGLGRKI